jgi:hypothetical protein
MNHERNCECMSCQPLPAGTHYKRLGDSEWQTVGQGAESAAYSAADPYELALQKLAASAHDRSRSTSTFEDQYKATRKREMMVTREALDAEGAAAPRLMTAELAPYLAPDPYRGPLEKMKRVKTLKQ